MNERANSVLVLACGNTLRGDDGVAWRIGETLEQQPFVDGIEVVFTRQLLPEHTAQLSVAGVAIFVDCSAVTEPGVVSTIVLSPAPSLPRIFTHHLDPASLLRLTLELYGRIPSRALAITVGGQSFALDDKLSEPVAAAIPVAAEAVRLAVIGEVAR